MTDTPPSATGLSDELEQAAARLLGLKGDAEDAAKTIESAFDRAGTSLTRSLTKASSDGKLSLGELASAAISAIDVFTRSATPGASGATGGLVGALTDVFKGVFGARADGGPVGAGGAYLVGERGPEVFRPFTAGEVSPLPGGGATVNVTVQGQGAPALLRSEAQIAAALARAVSLGGR